MDCPTEVKLIESLFEGSESIHQLNFNLNRREVTFFHRTDTSEILDRLKTINFPGQLIESNEMSDSEIEPASQSIESRTLYILLIINFGMFLLELVLGALAESAGLIADSIDMLADSLVYGISLFAVGKTLIAKNHAAFFSGILQMTLAIGLCVEVIRRFVYGSQPVSSLMIGVAILALAANLACLALIHQHKDGEVHMQASWIFSANDVIANLGVILAGIAVYYTDASYPDLIIGSIIAGVVFVGSLRILRLTRLSGSS